MTQLQDKKQSKATVYLFIAVEAKHSENKNNIN